MKYIGQADYSHATSDKTAILLTNLGTPDAPTPKALKRYLAEFLWDPRVVEVPRPIWWMILNLIILNVRPKRSAASYAKIWNDQGSPLLMHTKAQCEKVAAQLKVQYGDEVIVDYAMRYGSPSIESVIERLQRAGARRLLVLPLYPQYCAATTGSTFDAVADALKKRRWVPDVRFVSGYHTDERYIEALAQSVEQHWKTHERADRLVISYHGIPKRYLMAGDPYFCMCQATSRLLSARLGLQEDQVLTTFQSRFGREEWLTPYTDATLKKLPKQGVKSIQVICPGFSADCLETVEEIGEENRDYFLKAGGERYEYIAALNSRPEHIEALVKLVERQAGDWLSVNAEDDQRAARAMALGAKQ